MSVRSIQQPDDDVAEAARGGVLLDVADLAVHFRTSRGVVRAVDGVSFTLQRGRTLGVVGESGSGKSVTSKAIMGLLPSSGRTTTGSIRYEGRELVGLDANGYRSLWGSELSMVFQDPMTSLNPVMKIGPQITESLRLNLGMDRQTAKETAIGLLEAVRIPAPEKRFNEYPGQLSGGMRQRVVIAVALACGPKLLFADEPTTALDVTIQAQILDLMRELQETFGTAIILITHDMGVVAENADRVVVMYAGRKVEETDAARLFDNPGHPYTRGLLASIPHLDTAAHSDARRARLNEIRGMVPSLFNLPQGCSFAPRCGLASDRCREARPPLEEQRPGHWIACWHADKALAGLLVGAGA